MLLNTSLGFISISFSSNCLQCIVIDRDLYAYLLPIRGSLSRSGWYVDSWCSIDYDVVLEHYLFKPFYSAFYVINSLFKHFLRSISIDLSSILIETLQRLHYLLPTVSLIHNP
jgi:hypothetical protein